MICDTESMTHTPPYQIAEMIIHIYNEIITTSPCNCTYDVCTICMFDDRLLITIFSDLIVDFIYCLDPSSCLLFWLYQRNDCWL